MIKTEEKKQQWISGCRMRLCHLTFKYRQNLIGKKYKTQIDSSAVLR
jgi:hypothetical protein